MVLAVVPIIAEKDANIALRAELRDGINAVHRIGGEPLFSRYGR
jgi:hypothetical protein